MGAKKSGRIKRRLHRQYRKKLEFFALMARAAALLTPPCSRCVTCLHTYDEDPERVGGRVGLFRQCAESGHAKLPDNFDLLPQWSPYNTNPKDTDA